MVLSRRFVLQVFGRCLAAGSQSWMAFGSPNEFWNTEKPEAWTSEEIEELTTKSPWAKSVTAKIDSYSPLSSGGAGGGGRRGGGRMGRSGSAGAGSGPSSTSPKFPGVVRWASAKPIRLALKLELPEELAGHYVISVSGLPILSGHGGDDSSGNGTDLYEGLKQQTSLQVKGHDAIQPGVILPDKNETSTLYFGFLAQLMPLDGDKTVTFATTMEPLSVKVRFELKQMKFDGELAV